MMFPFLMAAVLAGAPNTHGRTVVAHEAEIIPVSAQIGLVTEIRFPKNEEVVEARCGNQTFFRVNKARNVLFVEPQDLPDVGGGLTTNVVVILTSGNSYHLLVHEISRTAGAHADLRLFIQEEGAESKAPEYVPADRVLVLQNENERLHRELLDQQKQQVTEGKVVAQEIAREVRMDYEFFDRKGKADFKPEIYSVKGFTYIKLDTAELPSVWSVKDGKPSKLNPTFANGKYEIQGVLDTGELLVGKSSVKFRRKG